MWALKYIRAIIIPLNVITVIVATAVIVILAGGIISQRLSVIMIINWGGLRWKQETGRSRRARKATILLPSHQRNYKQLWRRSWEELVRKEKLDF